VYVEPEDRSAGRGTAREYGVVGNVHPNIAPEDLEAFGSSTPIRGFGPVVVGATRRATLIALEFIPFVVENGVVVG
jgi:hypothetical protein